MKLTPTFLVHRLSSATVALLSLILTLEAHGGSLTWGAGGAGGAGTWDAGITANWWDGSSTVGWSAFSSADDNAVFSSTAGAVTIGSSGVTAHNLSFNTTGYTITGGNLTLDGTAPTLTLGSGISATIGANITGFSGLTKTGLGTLTNSGTNSYTGGTTLPANAGILIATVTTNRSGISSGPADVGAGSTLQLNNINTVNVTPIIANTFTGTGLLRLNFAAGTTARNTTMSNVTAFTGTIELANAGSTGDKWNAGGVGTVPAALQINSGSQLFLGAGTNSFVSISATGTGNSETRGAIRVSGATTVLGGPITLQANTTFGLETAGATISGNISGTAAAASTNVLTIGTANSTGAGTLSGVLSDGPGGGRLALTKTSSGTLSLTANSTYSGPTTITGGKIALIPGGSISNSVVTVNNTAGYILSIPVTDITRQAAIGGLVLPGANAALEFDFGTNLVPSTTLAPLVVSGDLRLTNANLVVKAGLSTLIAGNSYPLATWTGTVLGTVPTTSALPGHVVGTLAVVGGNTLVLNITQNNQQPLTWNAASASAPWDINITANWKDALGTAGQYYLQSAAGGDSVVFDDTAPAAGPLAVTVPATVTPASVAINNTNKNYTITGSPITGATSVTKSGPGSVLLGAANSYSGVTTINAGTIIVTNNTSLGSTVAGTTVNPGGTIDLFGIIANSLNLGVEVLTVAGSGVGGNGALVNNSTNTQINAVQRVVMAGNTAFGGLGRWDIRGTGNYLDMGGFTLTKNGTNVVSLVGTIVTNAGFIAVDQGMFSIQTTTTMGGSAANTVTVRTNATLDCYQSGTWTPPLWSMVMEAGASLSGSSGTPIWNGPITLSGLVTNSGGNLTLSGDISGSSGAIAKVGTGTLTLSGNNSYNGGTIITNGILVANTSTALGSGPVTINPTATRLVLNDFISVANSFTINGGGASGRGLIENSGTALGTATLSGGTITINNVPVAGGGHFASVSSGTLDVQDPINSTTNVSFRAGIGVFSGGGSYPGFLVTGTVRLGAHNGLSTVATVDVGTSGTGILDLWSFNQTLAGITRNSANSATIQNTAGFGNSLLTITGTSAYSGVLNDLNYDGSLLALLVNGGNLTLSGANTHAGLTTISAGGTLQIGAGLASGQLGYGNVLDNGTLIFNRSDSVIVTNGISGSGTLVKDGVGTTTLTGPNSYAGLTTVSNGTLYVRTDATGAGAYSVVDSKSLGVILAGDGGSLAMSSLSFGSLCRLGLTYTNATLTPATPIAASSGTVTLNGDVAVDVEGSVFTAPGTYVLLTCASRSGTGTFLSGNLPSIPGYAGRIVDEGTQVKLVYALPPNVLQWIGNVSGNWNTTQFNWLLYGTATPTNFSTYDTTRFDDGATGAGAVSVNVPSPVIPGSVTVSNETRDYTFTGSGIIQGANLVKQGAAKLTLANNNAYVGSTMISNGVVQVGNGGTTGSLGVGPVLNDATLFYNRSDSITNTVPIAGAGSLVQIGSGTLSLAAANTYTGNTTVSNGTVNASVTAAMGTIGSVMIAPNGTVNASATDAMSTGGVTVDGTLNLNATFAGNVNYNGPATSLSGAGVVNVTLGTNTQTVSLNGVNSGFTGTMNVGTNAAPGAGKIQLNNALASTARVNLLSNATLYAGAPIDNPASLFLYGGDTGEALGQLRLDSGATWSGPVTIAGNITSTNDGTVGANAGSGYINGNIGEIGGSRPLIKVGGATIVLSGNNTYTGGTTNKGGVLTANNNAAFGSGPVTVTTNATRLVINDGFTVANNFHLNGGGVAGRGLIENSGAGNATLSGGTVTITGPVAAGGHFASTGGGTLTVANPINSETVQVSKRLGVVIFSGGGYYTNFSADQGTTMLGAHNGLSTAATVDIGISAAANLDLAGYNQTLAGIKRTSAQTVIVTNSSTVSDSVLTQTGPSTYPGVIMDAGLAGSRIALVVNGGNLTLSGANTYSGGTLVTNSGVLIATVAGALGTAPVTNHGTLNLTGGAVTYTGLSVGLSGTGVVNVALGTGTGTTPLNGVNSNFTGVLNVGTNAVTGTPAVAGSGKVQLNGALGASAQVNILSNATVYVSATVTQTAPVILYGGDPGEDYGQLRLEVNSTWAGPVILAGDITTSNDGFLGSNNGTDNRISGNISEVGGSRAVTKLRSGTIALSGNNTYSGLTTISAGALRVESPTALGTTAAGTLVNSGASLQIRGGLTVTGEALTLIGEGGGAGALRNLTNDNTWAANVVIATNALTRIASDSGLLTIVGSVTLSNAPTDQLVLQGAGDITINGVVQGNSSVVSGSTGAGTRTLAGANTYTGLTTISGGNLRVTGSLAATTVTNIGGTLSGNGTLAGPVFIATNGILSPGASIALTEVLTINNTLSLAGSTVIQIGKSGATPINDRVTGLTDVAYGGLLVVTNANNGALAAGDVFTLFSASGAKTGNFTNILVQPASLGLTATFNPATGQLTLVPRTLSYTLTGGGIEFSWIGVGKLQVQTNSVDVGLSNNWVDYPGGGTSPVTVPVDAAQGTVFFRVVQ